MGTSLPRILRIIAAICFLLVFVGIGTLTLGTVSLNLLGFGLFAWVLSEL